MRKALLFLSLFAGSLIGQAQIQHEGISTLSLYPDLSAKRVKLKAVSPKTEKESAAKDQAFVFGENQDVNLGLNQENWIVLPNGDRVWLLTIEVPQAKSINLYFDQFELGEGASMYLHNADFTQRLGAFNAKNNKQSGTFSTVPMDGSAITIEITETKGKWNSSKMHLAQVTGGFGNWKKGFQDSGNCNIEVECPTADPVANQKRSVVLIISGGSRLCSGTLVNTTKNDQTPYILTAEHCRNFNVDNWVFVFDYKSPTCQNPSDGSLNKSVSGATVRVSDDTQDVLLLEMSEIPPIDYCVYYAGWNRSESDPSGPVYGLHHPSGDVMKVSKCEEQAFKDFYLGGANGNYFWNIPHWAEGTTEGGSSGSGLFNQKGQVIGHLTGGLASCTRDTSDFYSRLGTEWVGESNSTLQTWLDPNGTGITEFIGYDPCNPTEGTDLSVVGWVNPETVICGSASNTITLSFANTGTTDITAFEIQQNHNGVISTFDWTGTLTPGNAEQMEIDIAIGTDTLHNLTFSLLEVNGSNSDLIASNNTITHQFAWYANTTTLTFTYKPDDYGEENYWQMMNDDGILIAQGGPYANNNTNLVTETICVGIDCYNFVFTDTYGDGILDGGYYALTDQNGDTLASGWDTPEGPQAVAIDESHAICVETLSISELQREELKIYPNPTSNAINLELEQSGTVNLYSIDGKLVFSAPVNAGSNTIALNQPQGLYILKLVGENNEVSTARLVIE